MQPHGPTQQKDLVDEVQTSRSKRLSTRNNRSSAATIFAQDTNDSTGITPASVTKQQKVGSISTIAHPEGVIPMAIDQINKLRLDARTNQSARGKGGGGGSSK